MKHMQTRARCRGLLAGAALAVAATSMAAPAVAAEWTQHNFEKDAFFAFAPGEMTSAKAVFTGADGKTYPATIYSLVQGKQSYSVTVADFSTAPVEGDAALDYAVKALSNKKKLALDIPARLMGIYGRELNIVGRDGSNSMFSVYIWAKRLYVAEGRSLPPDASDGSSDSNRFTESVGWIFTGPMANQGRGGGLGDVTQGPPKPSPGPVAREPISIAVKAPKGMFTETWRWAPGGSGKVEYCRQDAKARTPKCVVADNPRRGDHMPASDVTPMIAAKISGQAWVAIGGASYICKRTSYTKGSTTEVSCQRAESPLPMEWPTGLVAQSNNSVRILFTANRSYYCQNVFPAPDDSKSQTYLTCSVL